MSSTPQFIEIVPEVIIYSENTSLYIRLKEHLQDEGFRVSKIAINDKLNSGNIKSKYFIIIPFYYKNSRICIDRKKLYEITSLAKKVAIKTLLVFPYSLDAEAKKVISSVINEISKNTDFYSSIIFIGDEISENFDSSPNSYLDEIINDCLKNRQIYLYDIKSKYYPLTVEHASKFILKSLFSMRAYGSYSALLGQPVSTETLLKILHSINPKTKIKYKNEEISSPQDLSDINYIYEDPVDILQKKIVSGLRSETIIKTPGSEIILEKAKNVIKSLTEKKENIQKTIKTPKPEQKKAISKKIRKIFILIIFLLLMPFLMLKISQFSFGISKYFLKKGDLSNSDSLYGFSAAAARLANTQSSFAAHLPLLDRMYLNITAKSEMELKEIEIDSLTLKLIREVSTLIENPGGKSGTGAFGNFDRISLELDDLFTKISLLESEGYDYQDLRSRILLYQKILSAREKIFGKENPARYLLLFQDNDSIKPTGGKIVAYGILTISNAEIQSFEITENDFSENKIAGQTSPPEPLKKYFNKNFWSFSDSNWYPDYKLSAEKAEWFLDKESDLSVDGVISISTDALAEMTKIIKNKKDGGGVPDGQVVGNDYKSFLQEQFNILSKIDKNDSAKIIYKLSDLLKTKQILMFSHEDTVEKASADLGWNGSLINPGCNNQCYFDDLGLVEYSESFGSENLKREVQMDVSFEEHLIKKNLTLYLENMNEFNYKTYIRLITETDAGFSKIVISDDNYKDERYPEIYGANGFKEAGVFIEIGAHQTKAINYSWESSIGGDNVNKYLMLVYKQPGVTSYPWEIKLKNLNTEKNKISPAFTLTDEATLVYNTNLSSDLKFSFERK